MKLRVIAAAMLIVTLQLLITTPTVKATPHTDIDADTAYNMITSGLYPNLVVLDVRTQPEFDKGHILRAILIPHTQLQERIGELAEHKNHEIIVYCGCGARSEIASNILDANGFTKVYDMFPGIITWIGKGYPVYLTATIDIEPKTTNLKNKGRWVTCYIELPEPYNVSDIDLSTVKMNNKIQAEPRPIEIGDHDCDGVLDLMIKFNGTEVKGLLNVGETELWTTCEAKGTLFEGRSRIRAIASGKKT